MDVTVFVLVSCYFIAVFSTAECVVFEINDYDSNRVVFVGEYDIVMTCSAPELNDPQFEISHQSNIIIDSQDNFMLTTFTLNKSIEVMITQVQEFQGGIYQCLVTGDGSMTLTNLTMDVRPPASTICPQSSETLNVNEGNSLSLFCYFLWSGESGDFTPYDYMWQEKSEPNSVPLNNSIVTQSSGFIKGIVIAFVGPFTADDDDTVYECTHPLPGIAGVLPCSVGPVTVTPRPTDPTPQTPTQQPVTVPATSTPIRLSTKASPPSTTTTYQLPIGPAKNTPTSSSSAPPPSSSPPSSSWVRKYISEEPMNNSTKNNKNIVIILLSIVVIMLAIVITILLCRKSQCKRKKRKDIKKEKSEFQLRGDPASISIQGKDEDGYLEPNPQFVNHISGRSDVGVAMATASSSMIGLHHDYEHEIIGIKKKQDDPSYEEVNHHLWNV